MKFFHLSDLHLGKRLNEFSLIEDQAYILNQIVESAKEQKPDVILISGDVYDKAVPTVEALSLFENFLKKIVELNIKIIISSGNHDSAERLAFCADFIEKSGITISNAHLNQKPIISCVTLKDDFGDVNFFLLPFIKPQIVRAAFFNTEQDSEQPPLDNNDNALFATNLNEQIETCSDAVRYVLQKIPLDKKARNVLLSHQFVTGALRSESEEIFVGGTDNVDASVYKDFDYVALGHIHSPQFVARETIRYCGTPLKYSFSEANQQKSITVVELQEKGKIFINTIPLKPLHDMVIERGSFDQVVLQENRSKHNKNDYYKIILTDEYDVPDALQKLREVFPNIMKLEYDNSRTKNLSSIEEINIQKAQSPLELFSEFYKNRNGISLSSEQHDYIVKIISELEADHETY